MTLWQRVDDLQGLPDAATASGQRALEAARDIARVRAAADALLAPYAARLEELSEPGSSSRFARWKGFPNAAALLSAFTGLSVTEAGKLIGLGRALAAVPAPSSDAAAGLVGGNPLEEPVSVPPPPAAPPVSAAPPESWEAPVPLGAPVSSAPPESPLAQAIRSGVLGTEKVTIIRRTLDDMVIPTAETEAFLVARAGELSIAELRRLCLVTLAERDPEGHARRGSRGAGSSTAQGAVCDVL